MSAHPISNSYSFKSDTATIAKGSVVKAGSDDKHVAKATAATQKAVGLAQNAVTAVDDVVEVAMPGGGAKGLLGGTVSFGDLLASDAAGALVATTTANDKIVAQALQDGVVGDLIGVNVVIGNY